MAGSGGRARAGPGRTNSGSPGSVSRSRRWPRRWRITGRGRVTRRAELDAIEAELAPWAGREPLAGPVARLGCYRGIAELHSLALAAEVAGWHRFPSARAFTGFTGLVPGEYSSGDKTRRGSITKAGSEPVRTALAEAAWAYRFKPAIGVTLRRRQRGAEPAPWPAPGKRNAACTPRTKAMTARGKPPAGP